MGGHGLEAVDEVIERQDRLGGTDVAHFMMIKRKERGSVEAVDASLPGRAVLLESSAGDRGGWLNCKPLSVTVDDTAKTITRAQLKKEKKAAEQKEKMRRSWAGCNLSGKRTKKSWKNTHRNLRFQVTTNVAVIEAVLIDRLI